MTDTTAVSPAAAGPHLLVTGGAGFIGQAVVEAALGRGWRVRVLDSLRSDVHGGLPTPDPRIQFLVGDVTDPGVVAHALAGIDVVCHQAAKVGLGVDFSDAPDYVHSNEVGTAVLLAGMAAAGIDRVRHDRDSVAAPAASRGSGPRCGYAAGRQLAPRPQCAAGAGGGKSRGA